MGQNLSHPKLKGVPPELCVNLASIFSYRDYNIIIIDYLDWFKEFKPNMKKTGTKEFFNNLEVLHHLGTLLQSEMKRYINFILNIYCCIYEYYYQKREGDFKYEIKDLVNKFEESLKGTFEKKKTEKIPFSIGFNENLKDNLNHLIKYIENKYGHKPSCSSEIYYLMEKFNEVIMIDIGESIQITKRYSLQ